MGSGEIELEGRKKTGLGLTSPDFITACLEGFEPPTFWFVAKHSIRLSYRYMRSNEHEILYCTVGALSMILNVIFGLRLGYSEKGLLHSPSIKMNQRFILIGQLSVLRNIFCQNVKLRKVVQQENSFC